MNRAFLFACLFACMGIAFADSGRVANSSGAVLINGFPLKDYQRVREGDLIVTGRDSHATIVMNDRSVIDLQAKTRFKLDQYSFNHSEPEKGSSIMNLLSGTFRYISGLVGRTNYNNARIRMGTVTAGIRGSFAVFNKQGEKAGSVQTEVGFAQLKFADGSQLDIKSGNTAVYNNDRKNVSLTESPTQVFTALSQFSQNKKSNLTKLNDAETTLLVMALISEGPGLGMTKQKINEAIGRIVKQNKKAAQYIAIAVKLVADDDQGNKIINTIKKQVDKKTQDLIDNTLKDLGKEKDTLVKAAAGSTSIGGGDGSASQ